MAFGVVGWCVGARSPVAFLADSREIAAGRMWPESDVLRAIFGQLLQQGYNRRAYATGM
jgi:dienelactone hydrolase